nr:amidohydrolase family protein [Myxosarcina sp. GI1]
MSTAAAKAYKIDNKGAIAVGYDADLVMVDLENYRTVDNQDLDTKCGWNPFQGWKLTGWSVVTIVNGQIVYERGTLHTEVRGKALTFAE